MVARLTERLLGPARCRLPDPRAARPARDDAALQPRPARPEVRAVGAADAAPARQADRRATSSPRSRPATSSSSIRTTRSRRASRRSCAPPPRIPAVVDAEDDRLPHEPRLGARAGADRGGRERQAERLHRRAEGALRRAPQHRVGALARAGRRPRRLRLPRPEDPREDDARDPPRGRRPAALRPHRHRQLPRDDRADLRGRRPLHRRSRHLGRHRRPVQLRHRASAGPSAFRKILVAPFNLRRELVERIRDVAAAAAAGERGPDPDQGEQHRRPGDRRGALQGVAGRRGDRPDRARRLHAPSRASRG